MTLFITSTVNFYFVCDIFDLAANNKKSLFLATFQMQPEQPTIFLSLIETNKGIIYKVANVYCKHAEDRKDLIQEIIVQLWRSFDRYNDQYKYTTWMYRIALNVAISFYRRENRRKQLTSHLPDNILDLAEESNSGETGKQISYLNQFIGELKELDKALVLLYLEEKSQQEIAEITGISETNVSTRIGRIKKILKQKFESLNA
jgi:RNA polymerase sigma factor (sigma-70 family)